MSLIASAPGPREQLPWLGLGMILLGLVVASITGEPYATWIAREVVAAAGLAETTPDMPLKRGTPFARGHTTHMPAGRASRHMSAIRCGPAIGHGVSADPLPGRGRPGVRVYPQGLTCKLRNTRPLCPPWPVRSALGRAIGRLPPHAPGRTWRPRSPNGLSTG